MKGDEERAHFVKEDINDSADRNGSVSSVEHAEAEQSGVSSAEHAGAEQSGTSIAVYVCGAVRKPGVYYLPSGARVCDAIDSAGGFSDTADSQWLNQAKALADGEMLVAYTQEETAAMRGQGLERGGSMAQDGAASDASSGASGGSVSGVMPVNLNTASKEQLMTLPGIGEAKADAIIRYRNETGFFATPEDVMNISGIKNSIYEKIRDRITV